MQKAFFLLYEKPMSFTKKSFSILYRTVIRIFNPNQGGINDDARGLALP
jgi:hypothetical protein